MKNHLVAFSLLLATGMTHATEYHVAKNGLDSNLGTSGAPILTIQHAADVAQPGDAVTAHAGTCRERSAAP